MDRKKKGCFIKIHALFLLYFQIGITVNATQDNFNGFWLVGKLSELSVQSVTSYGRKSDSRSELVNLNLNVATSSLHVYGPSVHCPQHMLYILICVGAVLEYCGGDAFNPKCKDDKVVIIQTARYGHIQLGKCVDVDTGHLGCSVDKLQYLDRQCSGKQRCEVIVGDANMGLDLPCASAFVRYLEGSFVCQKVLNSESCEKITVRSSSNYISSESTEQTGCGKDTTPLQLQAKPGQKINISMIDFYWQRREDEDIIHHKCPIRYGYIIDVESNIVEDICGGSDRVKQVYLSEGSNLQVVITSNDERFLLAYKAEGCPTFINPTGTWTKEESGEIILVGCNENNRKWKMRCIGNNWIGLAGNCTSTPVRISETTHLSHNDQILGMSQVVLMAIIISVFAIIICVVVTIILGFFCIRKQTKPVDKFYLEPMIPAYNNTITSVNHQHHINGTLGRNISLENTVNYHGTIQSNCTNAPQYFILENKDGVRNEPIYDAVYQNVND